MRVLGTKLNFHCFVRSYLLIHCQIHGYSRKYVPLQRRSPPGIARGSGKSHPFHVRYNSFFGFCVRSLPWQRPVGTQVHRWEIFCHSYLCPYMPTERHAAEKRNGSKSCLTVKQTLYWSRISDVTAHAYVHTLNLDVRGHTAND